MSLFPCFLLGMLYWNDQNVSSQLFCTASWNYLFSPSELTQVDPSLHHGLISCQPSASLLSQSSHCSQFWQVSIFAIGAFAIWMAICNPINPGLIFPHYFHHANTVINGSWWLFFACGTQTRLLSLLWQVWVYPSMPTLSHTPSSSAWPLLCLRPIIFTLSCFCSFPSFQSERPIQTVPGLWNHTFFMRL